VRNIFMSIIKASLAELYPELSKSWHPDKNGKLSPREVAPKSNKRFWWRCTKGHEWQAIVANRTGKNKTGCPYCSGRYATADNNLAINFPELLKEWYYKKNIHLNPESIMPYSHKKVWWKCSQGHEWQIAVAARTKKKSGCPFCSGRLASDDNCLQTLYPELAKEWHPTKNGKLTPKDVTTGTDKKVWWQCDKGHSWKAAVHSRVGKKPTGCPYCSGRYATADNNLAINFPELLKEWHYKKNDPLKPDELRPGSNKKVWWRCAKGHEWRIDPNKRIGKDATGCPYCAGNVKRDLEDFRSLIKARGGDLLSEQYKGAHTPLKVQCNQGHIFKISFPNARQGRWCPYCSISIGERMCRHAFETLLQIKFPKAHPKWLANPHSGKPSFMLSST